MDHWENAWVPFGVIDTHTHLEAVAGKGVPVNELLERLASAELIVDVSIDPRTLPERTRLAGGRPFVVHTTGVHPSITGNPDLDQMVETVERQLASRNDGTPVVAVGETGLDWYRMYAPRDVQIAAFERHLELARRESLPVVIHNREADDDIVAALRRTDLPASGVMHCFSADAAQARRFLDLGMYISFAGNLTYRSAEDLRAAFDIVPRDRLLLETDAPYLSPAPLRGRINHPAYLGHLYTFAADRARCSVDEMVEQIGSNARALFGEIGNRPG